MRASVSCFTNMLANLVKRLGDQIRRRRKPPNREFLEDIACLWKEFYAAKRDVKRRLATETSQAEILLRQADHQGFLRRCVEQGLLPAGAESFTVDEGAAFRSHYPTTGEPLGSRPLLISGGAFEMNRKRH